MFVYSCRVTSAENRSNTRCRVVKIGRFFQDLPGIVGAIVAEETASRSSTIVAVGPATKKLSRLV